MAELYLKTIDSGDPSGFSDGDIIQAFSNRQVLCHNAQMICNPRNFGFNPDGYRDLTTLTYFMFQEFYQHKFIRISKREVKRIDQDGNEEIFSDTTSQQIYVQEYINRRRRNKNHLIFGSEGKEYWFGGRSDFSQEKIDNLWSHITNQSGLLKKDYQILSLAATPPFTALPIGLDQDLTDKDVIELNSSITKTQLVDGLEQDVIIRKRKNFIVWQDIDLVSPVTVAKVNNINTRIDKRGQYPISLTDYLQVKNV